MKLIKIPGQGKIEASQKGCVWSRCQEGLLKLIEGCSISVPLSDQESITWGQCII